MRRQKEKVALPDGRATLCLFDAAPSSLSGRR